MALTITYRGTIADTTNGTSYAFPAFTPSANSVLVVLSIHFASDGSTQPTMSDSEGAWTRHSTTFSNSKAYVCWWRKVGASPVSITPTIDSTGDSLNGLMAACFNVVPTVVTTGSPIRQTAFAAEVNNANPAIVFASALQTANGYGMVCFSDNNPYAMDAAPTGWTQDADTGFASPTA